MGVPDDEKGYIIITGINSGIGKELTSFLLFQGYRVLGTSRFLGSIDPKPNLEVCTLELTSDQSIGNFCEYVINLKKPIEAIILNAGSLALEPLLMTKDDDIEELFRVNVFSSIRIIRKLFPVINKYKTKIIFISSDSGLVTFPLTTVYCMSKYATESLAEGLGMELKEFGIPVCTINPGNIRSNIMKNALSKYLKNDLNGLDPKLIDQFNETKPKIMESIEAFENAKHPIDVAIAVNECIREEKPKAKYLVTDPDETNYIIKSLIEKAVILNKSSRHNMSDNDLRRALEFALELD
jgi:short-subunit dehydrogenase